MTASRWSSPPPSARASPDLWELVDGGADFDEVLDGLLAGGIRTLTGFVLVGHDDSTRVLVRGQATVTVATSGGDVTVSGAGEAMWADRTLDGVTGGTVVLEGAAPADLALTSGIARVGSLLFGDPASVDGAAAVPPAPEALVADRDEVADTGPDTQDDPAARPEPLPAEPAGDSEPGRRPGARPRARRGRRTHRVGRLGRERRGGAPDLRRSRRRRPHAHRRAAPRARRRQVRRRRGE